MPSIFDGVDELDPCEMFEALNRAYLRLLAGESVVSARFGEDETTFNRADIGRLEKKVNEYQRKCMGRRRRAITTGFR